MRHVRYSFTKMLELSNYRRKINMLYVRLLLHVQLREMSTKLTLTQQLSF